MPDFNKITADVKQNINQIFREQYNLSKDQKIKIEAEKQLEINMRDSSEFKRWQ